MRRFALSFLVVCTLGAESRFARIGEIEGKAEVQLHATVPRVDALRNLAVTEGALFTTGPQSRFEIELDDGGVLRLAADSQAELADYTRLSTGQRITHIALDRGIAYFTGEPAWRDAIVLSSSGAQVTLARGSRVRVDNDGISSNFAVIEGAVRLATPSAEFDVLAGSLVRLSAASPDRFRIEREIPELDSDAWSRERDKSLVGGISVHHVPIVRYGTRDLDAHGIWIDTQEYGSAWKPKVAEDWAPFREGKWLWYEGLGYTWLAAEPWGWLPYHYGRWMLQPSIGWIWTPPRTPVFKPGDVYWLRGAGFAGWGPLAPGEVSNAAGPPQLFVNAHTTYARFAAGAREIDPLGFTARPKDPLVATSFAGELPALGPSRDRIEWRRALNREATIRVLPASPPEQPAPRTAAPSPPTSPARQPSRPPASQPPLQPTVVSIPLPAPVIETFYIAPVYTGIIVMDPKEKKPETQHGHKKNDREHSQAATAPPAESPRVPREQESIPREEQGTRRTR